MAYDEVLADRIRDVVDVEPGISERRMFGGLAFLVDGNMAVAASGQGGLMVRIDPGDTEKLTLRPHVSLFEMHGRAMNGWLHVEGPGLEDGAALKEWVEIGLAYARTLPAK